MTTASDASGSGVAVVAVLFVSKLEAFGDALNVDTQVHGMTESMLSLYQEIQPIHTV